MPAHDQQQQELPQAKRFKPSNEASIVQRYREVVQQLRKELTAARAEIADLRSATRHLPGHLITDRDTSMGHDDLENHGSFPNDQQDSLNSPAPSIHEDDRDYDRDSAPPAPSEETLRRYATTVAYSSYSMLCGTSDRSLTYHLFENDLQKEPSSVLCPKKMIEIPRGGHNIAYLREQIAEGTSLFAARMVEARRRFNPEVTTDDQVRRLGPANISGEKLPVYWIVTLGQQGVVDWEEGCSLARAYRRVFEDFCAEDVHCLVFEGGISGDDGHKAYAME